MGTSLITSGILLWFLLTLVKFVHIRLQGTGFSQTIKKALIPIFTQKGPEAGLSFLQLACFFWMICGIILIMIGDHKITGYGDLIITITLIVLPIWISALILKRKK
ncbi:MAG: hypothetical protein AB1522_04510 [Chloroflexota bacterium]|jgi:hypothetical protein